MELLHQEAEKVSESMGCMHFFTLSCVFFFFVAGRSEKVKGDSRVICVAQAK